MAVSGRGAGRLRAADTLRDLVIEPDPLDHPLASVLVRWGKNQVLCAVSYEEKVPPWRNGSGAGWVTGEYAMLPAATNTRNERDRNRSKPDGRTQEISRLLGRSLRAAVDLDKLGPRTLTVDCDVLQADGGTRCAAVTGGSVALALALRRLEARNLARPGALCQRVVAVSVGIVDGELLLDLDYADDHRAAVDMNLVLTADGEVVEIQGTGEGRPFSFEELDRLAALARGALPELLAAQDRALELARP